MKILSIKILFIFFIIVSTFSQAQAQKTAGDFQKSFSKEYKDALKLMFDNQAIIKKQLPTQYVAEAMACVFPEMVRFSEMKNMIETTSLEMLYVNWGDRYADFSIGYFQMKPSFVESMEDYVAKNNLSKDIFMPTSPKNDENGKRQFRIKNLRTWEGQLNYLKAFWQIVHIRFKDKKFNSITEKVHFFATAYNRGFLNTEQEIILWQKKFFFPHGRLFKSPQYNYGSIAQDFYERYAVKLFGK